MGESRVCIIKVCQRAEYQKTIYTDIAPALLTATVLWDMIREAPCGPSVYWLIQGFAHPLIPGIAHNADSFPCASAVVHVQTGLGGRAQRALTGNSMHLAAIGSWTLFNLSGVCARALLQQ